MHTMLTLTAAAALLAPAQATNEHPRDIVDTAVSAGSFGTLVTALKTADLVGALQGDGPFTVFAPTDEAFAKLPEATLQALLRPENRGELTKVLTYHVVPGRVSAEEAIAARRAASLQEGELSFRIEDGRLRVNDSNVVANDIDCTNGVVHVIDSVLLPPGGLELRPQGRLVIGVHIERPSRALAEQLGIERDETLLVTGVVSDGPSKKAGLRKYDIITAIDGEHATSASLKQAKRSAGYGGTLQLDLIRRGQPMHLEVGVGVRAH